MSKQSQIIVKSAHVLNQAEYGSAEYDIAAWTTYSALSSAQREVLIQLLFHGPVWDGDVASKLSRDDLITYGLAGRCCHKGSQGYTIATYRAYTVYHAVDVP